MMHRPNEGNNTTQVRLALLEAEIRRVAKFGTWPSWSPEDTNYLLDELRHRLVEDCPFPSYDELVVVAIDARKNAPDRHLTGPQVLRDLLELAHTAGEMFPSPVVDKVVLLLDSHLVKQGYPSIKHIRHNH